MNLLARLFAPLNHSGLEARRETLSLREANERQTEQVLRDELDDQYQIAICSTDPQKRKCALDEIDRIEALLRKT